MHVDEFCIKAKAKRVNQWPTLIDKLPNQLPPYFDVDHKIEVMLRLASPFQASYRFNTKLGELMNQMNDLMKILHKPISHFMEP
jgi:hypothetical protein